MKKIGEYTVRGTIAEGVLDRIQLFDGKFSTGYKVVDFRIMSSSLASSSYNAAARLSTEEIDAMPSSGTMVNFDDNRQIGWAVTQGATNGSGFLGAILDPDHLIVEDLFISGQNGGSDIDICYLITMEKYEFSDWKGALTMVRNKSQG